MLVQGTVDHKYCFTDINVGWPGSPCFGELHAIWGVNGTLMPESSRAIGSGQVPLYLIGDSAYPLQCWLMKPFPHNSQLSEPQKYYNYRMCHARIVVENASGRLKAWWCHLMKKNEMSVSNIPSVIAACCVLHNICEIHSDSISESWLEEYEQTNHEMPQPGPIEARDDEGDWPKLIRDALVEHLFSQH